MRLGAVADQFCFVGAVCTVLHLLERVREGGGAEGASSFANVSLRIAATAAAPLRRWLQQMLISSRSDV